MTGPRLRPSEEFLVLFDALRKATKYDPKKLKRFYRQSDSIKKAADRIFWFAWSSNFENLVEHGRRFHRDMPKRFSADYEDYRKNWREVIAGVVLPLDNLDPDFLSKLTSNKVSTTERPNFDFDFEFDPRYHNAGEVVEIGLGRLADEADEKYNDERLRNMCRVAVEGRDYINGVIGLDLVGVADRWRRVPVIYVPDHVSAADGVQSTPMFALLNDAVRAYVCGAPHAAIAMCRAVLERLLTLHYRRDEMASNGLDNLIDLCAEKYAWVRPKRQSLHGIRKLANKSLHSPGSAILGGEDEDTLLTAFANLKFLIEKAPKG